MADRRLTARAEGQGGVNRLWGQRRVRPVRHLGFSHFLCIRVISAKRPFKNRHSLAEMRLGLGQPPRGPQQTGEVVEADGIGRMRRAQRRLRHFQRFAVKRLGLFQSPRRV